MTKKKFIFVWVCVYEQLTEWVWKNKKKKISIPSQSLWYKQQLPSLKKKYK